MSSHTHTGSENIDITDNQISLNSSLKVNDEVVPNPRLNGYLDYMPEHQALLFYKTS